MKLVRLAAIAAVCALAACSSPTAPTAHAETASYNQDGTGFAGGGTRGLVP